MAILGHSGNWDAKSVVDVSPLSLLLTIVFCMDITHVAITPLDATRWNRQVCLSLIFPLVHSRASLASFPTSSHLCFDLTASQRDVLCHHAL